MNRIAVGVGSSSAAAAAVGWATEIAGRVGASLVAVRAIPERLNELPLDRRREIKEAVGAELESWVAPAVEAGVEVEPVIYEGDPRAALMVYGEDPRVDLVVVGRTGESAGPGFLHLGSVTEHLAHHGTFPLAVVVPGDPPFERIALGLDGSDESLVAARWCAPLAAALGASVVGVSIFEPIVELTMPSSPKNWRRTTETEIEQWGAPLTELGVDLTPVAERGLSPADGLLQVADARDADMLVLGTRGLGGFSGLRIGGVALKVLHAADRTVVLVPPG